MKRLLKTLKIFLISIAGLLGLILSGIFVYNNFFYEREMNQIKDNLDRIENVEVVNIWGHKDITLEEITARLKIDKKGEIVLYGLSKDVFNYPKSVSVSEIGGYSFTRFSCNGGINLNINIGQESEIGRQIGIPFNSASDVVENYDKILNVIDRLKQAPHLNHFTSANSESYLLVERKNSKDQDPIFNLLEIENKFEFAKTLKWTREDCYYNN
ncbi:hypothetical protein [Flavivirga algicola]|uniref:DUF4230 domain-containing protein n=1 Tax=Flavivirga algicola TaxID=2729136 RepID=A0ABX1S320_9FLAO|nr:hypothetical protein [Flavivirga algicola]NMH89047.1 hypothetical protein [Flavivirga algicola]